jgi:hypothetical protein
MRSLGFLLWTIIVFDVIGFTYVNTGKYGAKGMISVDDMTHNK